MNEQDWPDALPAEFYKALSEFNRHEYYACHETLEALWIPEKRSFRALYQGILQIAVGCYHLTTRANWTGAVNLLDAGVRRLEREMDVRSHRYTDNFDTESLFKQYEQISPYAYSETQTHHSNTDIEFESIGYRAYNVDWQALIADADRLQQHLRLLGRDRVTEYLPALLPQIRYTIGASP